jgi:DNA polymerase (family 10)
MDKNQIASILEDIAAMLELKGENPFKIRAYQNGARVLLTSQEDIAALAKDKKLTTIKGIGKGLAENITSLVETGKLPFYDELKKSLHPGLLELTRIQGVGPKKAVVLYEKLGVKDVPSLEKAAKEGKIAKLKGFGETTQQNILQGIAFHGQHAQHFLLDDAQDAAELVISELKKLKQVQRISACGSLRRHKEVVRDVDVLVSSDEAAPIMERFVTLPGVTRILGQGPTKSSILFHSGIQADLRVVTDAQFPFALHYFTGSKEHNIVMRQRAIARKMKLSEYGLFQKDDKLVPCRDEAELFERLGLEFIPPELREDRGEFHAAESKSLPKLLEVGDIKGVFHVHSTWSDGTVELEEMIAEAERMGFQYVGISDHSQIAGYAGGLSIDRVKQQGKVIEKLRNQFKIQILWGSECDILKDGAMDYPDEVLERYDFVIASVHSFFKLPEEEMTARIVKALQNKYVSILGHISGRLLLRREPYAINIPEVLKAAAGEGVAVEINGLPDRLELDWRWIPEAKKLGCRFSCNPDAHSKRDLHGFIRSVGIARKGWCTKADVINTLDAAGIKKVLRHRRP